VGYVPGDSTSGMFGGNSNWRGPDLDAGELPAASGAVAALQLLWRFSLRWNIPPGLGTVQDPV
jgi:hypothetical protein